MISGCAVYSSDWADAALVAEGSNIHTYDSQFVGVEPGFQEAPAGARLRGGSLFAVNSSFEGADGTSCGFASGSDGSGIVMVPIFSGAPDVKLRDVTLAGGAAAGCGQSVAGLEIDQQDGTVQTFTGGERTYARPRVVREGETRRSTSRATRSRPSSSRSRSTRA